MHEALFVLQCKRSVTFILSVLLPEFFKTIWSTILQSRQMTHSFAVFITACRSQTDKHLSHVLCENVNLNS